MRSSAFSGSVTVVSRCWNRTRGARKEGTRRLPARSVRPSRMDRERIPKYKIRGTVMKIDEILNYRKDQQLFQHIGDAFLPNGELKFPIDFGGLVPDGEPMHDQMADEVPDDIVDVATMDQRPRPTGRTSNLGRVEPAKWPGGSDLPPTSVTSLVSHRGRGGSSGILSRPYTEKRTRR
jgi:hypothetical protein